MDNANLATYLNDHLAGATAALDILAHVEKTYPGTELGRLLAELHSEIAEDRRALEALMGRLGVGVSGLRQAATWLGAKAAEVKLRRDDRAGGELRLLEALDIIASGVEGKRALWRALAAAAEETPGLRQADYAQLERRAEDQRSRLEGVRLGAAKAALGSSSDGSTA